MTSKAQTFVIELSSTLDREGKTGVASQLRECVSLHTRRLWHQLSVLLEKTLKERDLAVHLMALQVNFLDTFAYDLNQIKYVQLSLYTALHAQPSLSPTQQIDFLRQISERSHVTSDKSGHVLAQSLYGSALLSSRSLSSLSSSSTPSSSSSSSSSSPTSSTLSDDVSVDELSLVKTLISDLTTKHAKLRGAPKCVDAAFYHLISEYHLIAGPPEAFLENGLLYLAHQDLDDLSLEVKRTLAVDLCLASLCGEKTYNFGELLSHPILDVLTGTQDSWMVAFLDAFNRGDIQAYTSIAAEFESQLISHPSLLRNRDILKRKIQILGLMELIFKRDRDHRVLSFEEIAQVAELSIDQVEYLIIKALSDKLIRGTIDQVEQKVSVTWVQPRVLTIDQIASMKSRLDDWSSIVRQTLVTLESQSQDIVN